MRYALQSLWALLNVALQRVVNSLPEGKVRNAISTLVTVVIVIVIIAAGVTITLVIILQPGQQSTTTIYP
jgi:heme/copper-type cytochrome/quinol oxidase subunit 2